MSSIREAVERDRITVKIQNQSFQNNQMKRSASRDSPLRTKRGRPGTTPFTYYHFVSFCVIIVYSM